MANNFITINGQSRLGGNLLALSSECSLAQGRLQQLKLDMDNMTDGQDFATLETNFGIPTGKGVIVYALMAGLVTDIGNSINYAALCNYLGATR